MNRILALDQSSRENGWAVFTNNKLQEYGLIHLTDEDFGKRLVQLRKDIISLIEKYDINVVAFEDIQLQSSVGNNVQTFKKLANVYGVVLETAVELNKKIITIPSVTWKSKLKVKGRNRPAQKKDAQRYVLENYNLKVAQDTVDAICIGTCACMELKLVKDEGFNWTE